jgi:hypothetical protein
MIYVDVSGDKIELTEERWLHILREHPEISRYKERMQDVLVKPDYVKESSRDTKVLLYYKFYGDIFNGKYILTVVKKNLRSYVLTCYITDMIKKGVTLWEKK